MELARAVFQFLNRNLRRLPNCLVSRTPTKPMATAYNTRHCSFGRLQTTQGRWRRLRARTRIRIAFAPYDTFAWAWNKVCVPSLLRVLEAPYVYATWAHHSLILQIRAHVPGLECHS